ncbi:MAG TPA: TerB family tellurite resistance protein [Polyangiaceae bacterium]|nr:TerB family tellurite resistance protein [Polyangiaceae bacterium]
MDPRIAKCLLVSKVLVADGIMTENERVLLERAMDRMQLTAEEKRRVFDLEGWDDAEQGLVALSEDERREIIGQLVDAASVDGRLSPLELATIQRITKALGLEGR